MNTAEKMMLVESQKKSKFVAALLSFIWAGAGHLYVRRWFAGILGIFVTTSLAFAAVGTGDPLFTNALLVWVIVFFIDSILAVGRFNRKMTMQVLQSKENSDAPN